ncbi:MAG: domain protein putative component of TonB system [Labilithrix sp.]|nr:domain protein putative component of TonB system [Labilithrix sp.]
MRSVGGDPHEMKRMSNTTLKKALLAALVASAIVMPAALGGPEAFAQTRAPQTAPAKKLPAKGVTQSNRADAGADAATTTGSAPTSAGAGASDAGPLVTDGGVTSTETAATAAAPTARKMNPPPPPPSPAQVAALGALKDEVDAYEKGAKDYRDTVTTIIRLHYESKKKEVLSGLDREISIEKAELKKARDIAIARLENFIAVYSGPRAQPEATPDAMYRLAALYEERARSEEATAPVELGLKDAIALYKRIIREYPKYREIAGVYYFLGHALNDSGRIPEAMQVWRSLVCANHYEYPVPADPKDPEKDIVKPMPQDHDEAFWTGWRAKYRDPKSVSHKNADTTYVDPFFFDSRTAACQYLAQPAVRQGEDPKYVAEIWWQIGNWEFDQLDFGSGVTKEDPGSVWGYNRAASAYSQAMKWRKPPLYGVALYKYSWTLFKQQRYEAATKEFVVLLNYTDEQQKITGDTGADFRNEAYTYIAGSLTNVDFKGPEEWEPFIGRPDILDTEPRPEVAEKKLHVAIDRVRDPNLIPQDKPWTIEIYRALALEYRSLNQFANAVEVYEMMLQKWPMDPTAPDVQNAIAETYDQLNLTKRPGTPEHDATAQKALEARTKLANYIGNTPWVDANKDNPAAIQNAERLVRGGLRQAAAQHTNNGKAGLVAAGETTDPGRQLELLSRAATEYKLAGIGWFGYLKQDENAPDAYESRYWLADARRQYVRIQVVLHKAAPKAYPEPSKKDIDEALAAAMDVRDSNEDDKYLDNAAFFVVDVSDVDRDLAYQRAEQGSAGVEKRDEVKFDSPDEATRKPLRDAIPAVVTQSMTSRDEYVRIVPATLDVQKRGNDYSYYVAEQYFLYGQFDQARARFEPMWKDHCGKDELGYKAWEKLITMSNLERDAQRSIQLAEAEKGHSCAFNPEQAGKAGSIINPTIQEAGFLRAREQFEKACEAKIGQKCKNPDAPEKRDTWRKAGELYEAALAAAPGRDEAPEAAMNAAYAYKQIGEYNKAIALYNLFISDYGSDARLTALQKGDAKTKAAADPKKYAERINYLGEAYSALGETYYSFFNYQRAAETYDKVAQNERFPEQRRRDNAKNAMILYSNLGQREKMTAAYRILLKTNPSADDKAVADYTVASYDFKQWSPTAGDTGANRQQRFAAEAALTAYHQQQRASAGAAKYLVEAAYNVGRMKRSAGDTAYRQWLKNTVAAWDNYRAKAPLKDNKSEAQQQPYVDYAAEAEFVLLDEQITASFDTPEKHKYPATVPDIFGEVQIDAKTNKPVMGADGRAVMKKKGKYQANAAEAEKWDLELDKMIKKYESLEWVPTAIARQGAIYDTLRTGLYNMVLKNDELFTAKEKAFIKTLRAAGRPELDDTADKIEDAKSDFWRQKKQIELDGADQVMIKRYASAVAYARKYNIRNAQLSRAVSRLAYFTDIISGGDAKMAEYVTSTPDPTNKGATKLTYTSRQYVQTRPGLSALPPPQGNASALPAAP